MTLEGTILISPEIYISLIVANVIALFLFIKHLKNTKERSDGNFLSVDFVDENNNNVSTTNDLYYSFHSNDNEDDSDDSDFVDAYDLDSEYGYIPDDAYYDDITFKDLTNVITAAPNFTNNNTTMSPIKNEYLKPETYTESYSVFSNTVRILKVTSERKSLLDIVSEDFIF
uniref:CPXV149 protein n=1 Tax=Strongyloides stercoralis TaxID=6248 RepID=A0A0K0EM24_STRER